MSAQVSKRMLANAMKCHTSGFSYLFVNFRYDYAVNTTRMVYGTNHLLGAEGKGRVGVEGGGGWGIKKGCGGGGWGGGGEKIHFRG